MIKLGKILKLQKNWIKIMKTFRNYGRRLKELEVKTMNKINRCFKRCSAIPLKSIVQIKHLNGMAQEVSEVIRV
jgi:esterase/lipase